MFALLALQCVEANPDAPNALWGLPVIFAIFAMIGGMSYWESHRKEGDD